MNAKTDMVPRNVPLTEFGCALETANAADFEAVRTAIELSPRRFPRLRSLIGVAESTKNNPPH